MSATQNAKVVFEADTRDLSRGAKQARQELKDFGKTSNEVTQSIGDAFGVNTKQLEQLSNSAKEMGRQLSESGNTGVAAFGKLLQSIDATKVALAGMGIGAAITAFKLLNAEAENFKNTVAGANIEMATSAYISTYTQVLHDFNAETGKSVAEFEAEWKKGLARFKANLQQNLVNGLTGQSGLGAALAGPVLTTIFGGNKAQRQQARQAADLAEQLTGEIYTLERKIKDASAGWIEMERKVTEYQAIIKSNSSTLLEKEEALAAAQELIKQRYGEEYELRSQIAAKAKIISDQASDDLAAADNTVRKQQEAESVLKNQASALKGLVKEQNALASAANSEAEARRAAVAAAEAQRQAMAAMRAEMSGTDLSVSQGAASGIQGRATTMEIGAIIKPTYDPKQITDISKEVASLVEQGVASMSDSIGTLIGDLAAGGDAWHNFASNALSAFGDMAVTVGKMAIATGTATLGIKAALESLNGYVAIAAGAALVALGSAVKAGLGNVASGNYSASASVAPATYGSTSSMGGGYATSAINVKVTGTLTAQGNQLKAVIDNENSRRNTVT